MERQTVEVEHIVRESIPLKKGHNNGQVLRILTYHRIARREDFAFLNPRLISASPEMFYRQMRYLKRHYQVMSVEEVLMAIDNSASIPPRSVMITFDDGYVDFKIHAWPILIKFGLPVTLFVPTGFPGRPERSFWWDRLYRAFKKAREERSDERLLKSLPIALTDTSLSSLKSLQEYLKSFPYNELLGAVEDICSPFEEEGQTYTSVLDWDELAELARQGVALGSHTRNHAILKELSEEDIENEIRGSMDDLERQIGSVLPIFCSPNGGDDDRVVNILRDVGIRLAFGTRDGHNKWSAMDLLRLKRTNITPRTKLTIFKLRLLKSMGYVDRLRHRTWN